MACWSTWLLSLSGDGRDALGVMNRISGPNEETLEVGEAASSAGIVDMAQVVDRGRPGPPARRGNWTSVGRQRGFEGLCEHFLAPCATAPAVGAGRAGDAPALRDGGAQAEADRRHAVGDSPNARRNVALKCEMSLKPMSKAMRVIGSAVSVSRSAAARSRAPIRSLARALAGHRPEQPDEVEAADLAHGGQALQPARLRVGDIQMPDHLADASALDHRRRGPSRAASQGQGAGRRGRSPPRRPAAIRRRPACAPYSGAVSRAMGPGPRPRSRRRPARSRWPPRPAGPDAGRSPPGGCRRRPGDDSRRLRRRCPAGLAPGVA